MIKVMNLVAILIAPIAITDISNGVRTAIVIVAAAALAGAVLWSKRGGIESEEEIEKELEKEEKIPEPAGR